MGLIPNFWVSSSNQFRARPPSILLPAASNRTRLLASPAMLPSCRVSFPVPQRMVTLPVNSTGRVAPADCASEIRSSPDPRLAENVPVK